MLILLSFSFYFLTFFNISLLEPYNWEYEKENKRFLAFELWKLV